LDVNGQAFDLTTKLFADGSGAQEKWPVLNGVITSTDPNHAGFFDAEPDDDE